MNIVLFEASELSSPLPREDRRARHILEVLRRNVGDEFDAGIIDGPRGKSQIVGVTRDSIDLKFSWGMAPPPLADVQLLIGLPRPQTAKKILAETTALGVRRIAFFPADRGVPQYAESSLWKSAEWRRHLVEAAAQAFCTRLPEVTLHRSSVEAFASASACVTRIALDNYEASSHLHAVRTISSPLALAFGPERGWTAPEREQLRHRGFVLCHLGARVLRLETAVVAALALALPHVTDPAQ